MDHQELYDYILDNLEYRLEKVEGKDGVKWCLSVEHYSGHYANDIPIEYLEDDRIDTLEDEVFSDFEYEYGDADWEEFHDVFEEVFYKLVDENLGR